MWLRCMRSALAATALSLVGCAHAPMTYLRTFGPAADPVARLGWGLLAVCSVVVVVITALVASASARARTPPGPLATITPTRPAGGARWIYIGTGVSTAVLLALVSWTMITLKAIANPSHSPSFTVEIHAHQWWWEMRYIDDSDERIFVTANELHIPVGKPVRLRLIGDDVIHSFWIPALAGKTDVIPGQTNSAWLQADVPGTFRGQCTEYCGAQHAHMAAFAVAESPAAFDAWWDRQVADAAPPASQALQRGAGVFQAHCAACHAVRGTQAGGILGPDLTHLMSRSTIGAGTLSNSASALRRWIANAQDVKPGCQMPDLDLSAADLSDILEYVQTLR